MLQKRERLGPQICRALDIKRRFTVARLATTLDLLVLRVVPCQSVFQGYVYLFLHVVGLSGHKVYGFSSMRFRCIIKPSVNADLNGVSSVS